MRFSTIHALGLLAATLGAAACASSADDSASSSDSPAGGEYYGGPSQGTGGSTSGSNDACTAPECQGEKASTGAGGSGGTGFNGGAAGGSAQQPGAGGGSGSSAQAAGSGGSSAAGGAGAPPAAGAGGTAGAAGAAGGEAGAAGSEAAAGAPPELPLACQGIDSSAPKTIYVSADDSNSMASPVLARKLIHGGQNPPSGLLRTYEFLNYYNVAYAEPAAGQLSIVPQMRPAKKGGLELQIGVQSPPAAKPRRPMNITFVLDTSGSMQGEPMDLQRAAMLAISNSLRAGDIVSMTTWNTNSTITLASHTVGGPGDPGLLAAIDGLVAGGGTDLHGGLVNGYKLAKQNYSEDRMNRVVVISDGVANVGITDEQMIGAESDVENKEGIYLVGVGVGAGVNDTLLNVVTDAGNGAYIYLDTEEEAQRMFGSRFDEAMDISARDVQISMTIPWYLSIAKFAGEQFSVDPSKVKPQNLAPGDAMVVNQTLKACDESVINEADPLSFAINWLEPLTYKKKTAQVETTVGALLAGEDAQLRRGRAIVGYVDVLRSAPSDCAARSEAVNAALALVDEADPAHNDSGLVEIAGLLEDFRTICY
jgi:Ca-activated chloride channel homolog